MMNSELNNHQTDWLAQTVEINDLEASQVNGGIDSEAAAQSMQSMQSALSDQVAQMSQSMQATQAAQAAQSDQARAKQVT